MSVVVPAVGNVALTRDCVRSLREHTSGSYEIVLVDNASSDGSTDCVARTNSVASMPQVARPASVERECLERTAGAFGSGSLCMLTIE